MLGKREFVSNENMIRVSCTSCKHLYVYGGMFVDKRFCTHPEEQIGALIHVSELEKAPIWCPKKRVKLMKEIRDENI